MENVDNILDKLDDVINVVTSSNEYKMCIDLKKKMSSNLELKKLIDDVKILQKKYVKTNYSDDIKQELDDKINELEQIPIYNTYNENLKIVNNMLDEISSVLSDYFYKKLNDEIEL